MRRFYKLLGIAAIVAAIGLAGCSADDDGEYIPPTYIVIEGLPSFQNGSEGTIRIFSELSNSPINAGIGYSPISDGRISVELSVPHNNLSTSQTKWTGNGSYYIYFMSNVYGSYYPHDGMIYVGNGQEPQKYNINESVITIPYSAFMQYDYREH
ncbi:MAG: hypothetical protein LBL58_10155 [Tannerellaceae bacterium]|jgi:hypothetical protein|nr:hypothetical protein [Tannerellaceae bacterium]